MKHLLKIFTLVAVFILAACSTANEPGALADKAASCMQEKDFEGLMELMDSPKDVDESQKAQMLNMLNTKFGSAIDSNEGIKSYKIGEKEVDEEKGKAKVEVEFEYGNGMVKKGYFKFKKEKEDGKWYLTFM